MKHIERIVVVMALVLVGIVAGPATAQQHVVEPRAAAPVRLLLPVNDLDTVTLPGTVRTDLTPDQDMGPVEDSMQLHLYMVLQRTPEQEADLDYLIARQQERNAPEYHQWLTPEQFGARFGAHPQDIAKLSDWLQSHGMEVRSVLKNASIIDFAATAGQIREAFHTELHYFNVAGGKYAANAAEPQIPAALAPLVAGIQGMVKIPMRVNQAPMGLAALDTSTHTWRRVNLPAAGQSSSGETLPGPVKPNYDPGPGSTARYVSPRDLYTIYNINPIFAGGDLAQTASVAVVEQSDMANVTVNSQTGTATGGDLATFRSVFNVPGTLNMHVYHGFGNVVPCKDPGIVTTPNPSVGPKGTDEIEATVDAEWANATAPSANLIFNSCDDSKDQGALTSLLAVIEQNLADVISLSYTVSELSTTTATYKTLDTAWAQAATQGQSILVAAGNGGSDEEDFSTNGLATHGLNISAYSSPNVTVVGATDFQDAYDAFIADTAFPESKYWSTTNSAEYYEDALGYVPESAWNDSCASLFNTIKEAAALPITYSNPWIFCALEAAAGSALATVHAGGGGISIHYDVPAWQAGISGYTGTRRSIPDIASFGSNGTVWNRALLACVSVTGATCANSSTIGSGGGTDWVAPYMAGIAALLRTYTGSRQGVLNPALYALAKVQYTASPASCYANGQPLNDEQTKGLPAASCIFNDVTTSVNDVPCPQGSPNCVVNAKPREIDGFLSVDGTEPFVQNAYASAAGYDRTTGLGSLNVNNLITKWYTAFSSATTLTASSTHITPSGSTTLRATVTGKGAEGYVDSPPLPSGTVSFKAGTKPLGSCTLSGGSCTLVVNGTSLASGANSITATFAASRQYPSSTSSILTLTVGPVATPTFTPAGGTYTSRQTVTIADATAGATIYYTTNGTTPTTASARYTGAISVSTSETIEAIAVQSGSTSSAVASARYTLN